MDFANDLAPSKRAREDDHESRVCPICIKGFRLQSRINIAINPNNAQTTLECGHSYHLHCFNKLYNTCPEKDLLKCCYCCIEITKNLHLEAIPILDPIRVAIDTQHDAQEEERTIDHLRQESLVHDSGGDAYSTDDSEDGENNDPDYVPPTVVIPDPDTTVRRSSRNITTVAPVAPEITHEIQDPTINVPLTRNEKIANEIREKLHTYIEGQQPILAPKLGLFLDRFSSTVESADVLELIQDIQGSVERLNSIVFYFIGHLLNNAKTCMSVHNYNELWKKTCLYLAQRRKIKKKTVYKYCQYAVLVDTYPILFLADCKYGQLTQIPGLVKNVLMEEPIQEYNIIHAQLLTEQLQILLRQN